MTDRWTICFARHATEDKYKIPRGEAARFAEAVAVLYYGPELAGVRPVEDVPNVYEYSSNGYLIAFEALQSEKVIRVLYFALKA